jgi:hypothetical protein
MKIFDFDATELAPTYRDQQWIHIQGGATDEFCDYVRGFVRERSSGGPLSGKGIAGAKDQFVLEFPPDTDYTGEIFDHVATLCDLRRATMTLSERHIKMYDADAVAEPRPHKDRYASQVAVGVSIEVPESSRIILYPNDAREANPLLRAGLIDTLPPDEQPEVALRGVAPVEIADAPGDVQMFPGGEVWHGRRNSAGTVIVYLKVNDFGCDPLGEDPATPRVRERTLALLGDDDELRAASVRLGRGFESVTREYSRAGWRELLLLNVWDQPPRRIGDEDFELLRAVDADGGSTVETLIAAAGGSGPDGATDRLRRLAELGALDLVSATG